MAAVTSKKKYARVDTPDAGDESSTSSEDESVSDDDESQSSESSDSSSESPDAINADKIRQNARELLKSSPDRGDHGVNSSKKKSSMANTSYPTVNANRYQSYHDAPTARMTSVSSAASQFVDANAAGSVPPWGSNSGSNDEGLTVTDVASMAFSCIAHCLTEGYRAASNYYSAYEQGQYPSASGQNNAHNVYQQVDSSNQSEGYNKTSQFYNDGPPVGYKNGYTDGYQNREVMDRGGGLLQSGDRAQSGQSSGEKSVQSSTQWEKVDVPSTYQGGRVPGSD